MLRFCRPPPGSAALLWPESIQAATLLSPLRLLSTLVSLRPFRMKVRGNALFPCGTALFMCHLSLLVDEKAEGPAAGVAPASSLVAAAPDARADLGADMSIDPESRTPALAPLPAEWDDHVDWLMQGGDDGQRGGMNAVAAQPAAFRAEEADLDDVFDALSRDPAAAPRAAATSQTTPASAPLPLPLNDKGDLAFLYEDSGDDAEPGSGPMPRPMSSAGLSGPSRRPGSTALPTRSPYLSSAGGVPDRSVRPVSQGQSKRFFPRRPVEGIDAVRRSATSRPRTVSTGALAAGSDPCE